MRALIFQLRSGEKAEVPIENIDYFEGWADKCRIHTRTREIIVDHSFDEVSEAFSEAIKIEKKEQNVQN